MACEGKVVLEGEESSQYIQLHWEQKRALSAMRFIWFHLLRSFHKVDGIGNAWTLEHAVKADSKI